MDTRIQTPLYWQTSMEADDVSSCFFDTNERDDEQLFRKEIPQTIDRFEVVAKLGHGGQGEVYRVTDPGHWRMLALKISSRPMGSCEATSVINESRILTHLQRTKLARIHATGSESNRPFLVRDFVRGRSLSLLERERPLSCEDSVAVIASAAHTLERVHRCGVVHRDIKPSNIVASSSGKASLIDFGLAARYDTVSESSLDSTVQGTLSFMAPEQACGDVATIGPRTDIFSLGATLFYALTGQAPFHERSVKCMLVDVALGAVDLQPLSERNIPSTLRCICTKAMALNPLRRHPRALDLAHELERYLRRNASGAPLSFPPFCA